MGKKEQEAHYKQSIKTSTNKINKMTKYTLVKLQVNLIINLWMNQSKLTFGAKQNQLLDHIIKQWNKPNKH